jgi:hypothetical protein
MKMKPIIRLRKLQRTPTMPGNNRLRKMDEADQIQESDVSGIFYKSEIGDV